MPYCQKWIAVLDECIKNKLAMRPVKEKRASEREDPALAGFFDGHEWSQKWSLNYDCEV
ncbi:hypothetical protein ABEV55_02600 [Aneurinibacillus thermoaerophilus]|uniref:hypothetical protein n=1 Tax=Aneurinibacillus thermoaerophilus TaxID=143495 RepID=UPI002E214C13|nr:hypothetical protein [Aneurinibacillus thermoaerophilus]